MSLCRCLLMSCLIFACHLLFCLLICSRSLGLSVCRRPDPPPTPRPHPFFTIYEQSMYLVLSWFLVLSCLALPYVFMFSYNSSIPLLMCLFLSCHICICLVLSCLFLSFWSYPPLPSLVLLCLARSFVTFNILSCCCSCLV